MKPSEVREFQASLCEALGLDPNDVFSLSLFTSTGGQVHVSVEMRGPQVLGQLAPTGGA